LIKNLSVTNITSHKINKIEVHSLVNRLKKELNISIDSVTINFLTENHIIPINNRYLGHNYSTDIITFNYSGENYTLDGEIFISLDDASFYAEKYGVKLNVEILRLIIHGFLHLIGYNDHSKEEKRKMKRFENKLVNKYLYSITKLC